MAYNNFFPVGYQPYYPTQANAYPTQMNVGAIQPTQSNGIIWVQGEAGAKSYLVAPNQSVPLWDSEAQVIYIKSADASGMPSIKVIDYTIRDAGGHAHDDSFATKEELDVLRRDLQDFRTKYEELLKCEEVLK